MIFLLFALPFTNAQYGSNGASMTTSVSSSTTASASSSTHTVDVGNNGFTFNPDTLTVSPGEKVEFHFFPQNHSVAQASFNNPCHPMNASSFSSGFVLESVSTPGLDGSIVPDFNRKRFLLWQSTTQPQSGSTVVRLGIVRPAWLGLSIHRKHNISFWWIWLTIDSSDQMARKPLTLLKTLPLPLQVALYL